MVNLTVERHDGQFRVVSECFTSQWLPDSQANRKTMIITLNLLVDGNGSGLFKDCDLAQIVEGSHNRGIIIKQQAKFNESGQDFLEFLNRNRIYDNEIIDFIKNLLKQAPLISLSEIQSHIQKELGLNIGRSTIDLLLERISYADIHYVLKQQLSQGKIHYKEEFVIQQLFSLVNQSEKSEKIDKTECAVELIPVIQACEPIILQELIDASISIEDEQAIKLLEQRVVNNDSLADFWKSKLSWKFLAFLLYFNGVSLSIIGGWFGHNKSTICRWLDQIADLSHHYRISLPMFVNAGHIAIDEKFIKIDGQVWYLFAAVDCISGYPIYSAIYPSNGLSYCQLFLQEIKRLGYRPKSIITDGHDAYIKAIAATFPNCRHLLCRFHVLHRIFEWLRSKKIFIPKLHKITCKLFKTKDKRTVKRRIKKFKEQLPDEHKHLGDRLDKKLPQVLPAVGSTRLPSTSNSVESFFSTFDRFYRNKGPFVDLKSAQKHLDLFMLGYLFSIGQKAQPCPLEKAGQKVSEIPFYHIFNRPNLIALRERIGRQVAA